MSNFWRSLDLSLTNRETELDLSWSRNCVIPEIPRTTTVSANWPNLARAATETNNATFHINNAKLHVHKYVHNTLSINNNIKSLENIKPRFKRTAFWNGYRSEITTHPKNNYLDYMIDLTLGILTDYLFFYSGIVTVILQKIVLISITCH